MTLDYAETMTQFEIPSNPFPGLRPFEFNESLLYFGRDGQSEQLLRKLSSARFMAVVGTSGSGKSSLVRAGLLPALFGGFMMSAGSNWRIAMLRPGNDPIGNLARALNASGMFETLEAQEAKLQATMTEATLRRSSLGLAEAARHARLGSEENLLVVADQFEELFRFAAVSENERYQNEAAAFVKLLLEGARQREFSIYVVLTMRSDFLGDCSQFWDLPEAINEGQYLIPRLTREQRREAITGPVAVCGASITPRLVNRLLNDMGDNQDQLPILQHALMRTWNKWKAENQENEPVDLRHYESIGGMAAALSLHADEAFNELAGERSQKIAEKIFKGLTEKGADNREIRRPVELREIAALAEASEAEVISVIEVFRHEGRSFLMPPAGTGLDGGSLIDISHESLIRNWERLKAWVDEEARSARIYRRLADTAALYEKGEAGLWRDPDLELALDWREQSKPNKSWARRYNPEFETAMNFLDRSREARDLEARDREAHRRREIKRTRLTAFIFALAFLLSLAALVFANIKRVEAYESKQQVEVALAEASRQRNDALEQTRIADEERLKAEKQSEIADKQTIKATDQARIASENEAKAEAATIKAQEETQRAEAGEAKAKTESEKSRQFLYAISTSLIKQAYEEGSTELAQDLLEDIARDQSDLRGFEWKYLERLLDRGEGALDDNRGVVRIAAYSPSKENPLVATAAGNDIRLWNASTREKIEPLLKHDDAVSAMAFSPDGKILATGSEDKIVRLWIPGSSGEPVLLGSHPQPVTAMAFSPDGKTLATAAGDYDDGKGSLKLWDAASRQLRFAIRDIADRVTNLAFSPDGKKLAIVNTVYNDRTQLHFFDMDSRKLNDPFELYNVGSIAFSPDGKVLAAGTDDGERFKLFEIATGKQLASLDGFGPGVDSLSSTVAFSPDGKILAAAGTNTLKLYDAACLCESSPPWLLATISKQDTITSIAFSPDSKTVITNSGNSVKLWDASANRESITVGSHDSDKVGQQSVTQATFSSDGKMISTIGTSNFGTTLKLWDAISNREIELPSEITGNLLRADFSPNGKYMATIDDKDKDKLKLWEIASRRLLATIKHEASFESVTVSPDGKRVITSEIINNAQPGGGTQYSVKLWEAGDPLNPILLNGEQNSSRPLAFSPDGKTLAGVDENSHGVLQLWDIASRKAASLTTGIQAIKSIVFSADSKKLAVFGEGNGPFTVIEIWDGASRKRLDSFIEQEAIKEAVFSQDGKMLIVSRPHRDRGVAVALRDINLHKRLNAFVASTGKDVLWTFSPDGRTLITAAGRGDVTLWSTSSSRSLATFKNGEDVTSIAFSPDGRLFMTGGASGSVRLWPAVNAAREK